MEKQFVPYELAVKLKEFGFDEPCFARFRKGVFQFNTLGKAIEHNSQQIVIGDVSAPLWQQAFDWFSEEYKINNFVHRYIDGQWCFEVFRDDFSDCWEMYFHTKQQARHACLEKLIELLENKK